MTDIAITAEPVLQAPFSWKWFLFSFKGRITRSQYWIRYTLVTFLAIIAIGFVVGFIEGFVAAMTGSPIEGIGPVSALFSLACFWPSIAVPAKRLHDRDQSGWWQLLGLIPIIGWIYLLVVLGFLRGTRGPNRFGPDPLEP